MALESDSRKLFVAGLADSVTEQSLREWFEAAGLKVSRVGIPFDRTTGRSRGFAFVTLDSEADAEKARQELDGSRLEGRELAIREFRAEAPKRGPGFSPQGGSGYGPQTGPRGPSARPGARPMGFSGSLGSRPAGPGGPGPVAPRPQGSAPRPMPARPALGTSRPAMRPGGGGWGGGGESQGESRAYSPAPSITRATWDEPRRSVSAKKEKDKPEKRKKGKKLTAERGHLRRTSEAFRWQGDEDDESDTRVDSPAANDDAPTPGADGAGTNETED